MKILREKLQLKIISISNWQKIFILLCSTCTFLGLFMKKYLILGLILLTTIISAKPTIGFIDINFKSSSLKNDADNISVFLNTRLEFFLGEDYKVTNSTAKYLKALKTAKCVKQDMNCMFLIAKLIKVDYLIYGKIERKDKSSYSLSLIKIDVKKKKALPRNSLEKVGDENYKKVIDNFISGTFPKFKTMIDSISK